MSIPQYGILQLSLVGVSAKPTSSAPAGTSTTRSVHSDEEATFVRDDSSVFGAASWNRNTGLPMTVAGNTR